MPLSPQDFRFVTPPSDYGPKPVDFSQLGNLLSDYQKAQLDNLELQQKQFELQQYRDYYGGGGPSGNQPSYGAQPDYSAAPGGATPTGGTGGDPRGKIPVIVASAQKYGIDPATAVRVARSEGLNQFTSGIRGEDSFGAFQLNTQGGMGNDFQRDTGLDPRDPKNEDAAIDYALRRASKEGWGAFHGARNTGIGQWAGINRGAQVAQKATEAPAPSVPKPEGAGADGTSTAAPAPHERVASAEFSGPPFAPTTTAAMSTNGSGPQNINLASTSPNIAGLTGQTPSQAVQSPFPQVGGLTPQPPATVAPTSPAEVAGTQGGGTQAASRGAPITPGGNAAVPQGPATSTSTTTAQATPSTRGQQTRGVAEAFGEPESDPRIRAYDDGLDRIQNRLDQIRGLAIPPAQREREQLQNQQKLLMERRNKLYDSLREQYGKQQETREAKTRAEQAADVKTFSEELESVTKKGDDAAKSMPILSLAQSLMNDPSYTSGTFADNVLSAKRLAVALGRGDESAALTQEAFRKVVNEAILEQVRSLGGMGLGQVRAKEFEMMTKAAQSTENTPATNRLLTEMATRAAQRWSIPLARMADQYASEHGGHLDAGWRRVKADFLESHPIFSDDELRDPRRIAPIYARSPQEAQRKGWHEGEPLRVPPPPGAAPGTPDRVITHLRPQASPNINVAPVQQQP